MEEEHKRRKREGILIVAIIAVVTVLTFAVYRIIHFGIDIPISNTILIFILININLLLLILLIFLAFRNLIKLLYDRKRKVMGAKLRTKLVVAFIALTLLPTTILFFFSIKFITASIEFWFNVPVEQALEDSLLVGGHLYKHTEKNNRFFLERVSYQIETRRLLDPAKKDDLSRYIQVVQRAFNFHAVEVYAANSNRLILAIAPELEDEPFKAVSAENLQKERWPNEARSIFESIPAGELIRTIGTVPFGIKQTDAKGFVVLTVMIPPYLSKNIASISRGVEEYRQIKLLKEPIRITYYLTLSIVALLVVFCATWFGLHLARSITTPIKELAEGTRRVAEGDLGFSIGAVADDEIGSLVDSFNRMTGDLRISREQLELSARMLRKQNIEIEERRQYMETVLKNVSAGVITLDADGLVSTINRSAERMLNLSPEKILNESYKRLLKGDHLNPVRKTIKDFIDSKKDAVKLSLKLTVEERPRSFMLHINRLKDDSGHHMGMVMVFDDLTELEKAQRMMAWREVARRIAHEVKNPLTPITLSAQRLERKYLKQINESVFKECTRTIVDHVDLIRNLVNEFSTFARFPTANPKPCDLVPIIKETVALYKEEHQNINFKIDATDSIPPLNLDRHQIKQAMINLVNNAIAAIKEEGNIFITLTCDPVLKMVRIEVADDGAGISDEDKTHLFEPYFSTKRAGMGLGLAIVNTIIADHKGAISVQDNHPQGAKFVIELPV